MQTLAAHNIESINLNRQEIDATNNGHDIGYETTFTRTDGTQGIAQSVYFETDGQSTTAGSSGGDPAYTLANDADKLPQLARSGTINSIAYTASTDAAFAADWQSLTDTAETLTPHELDAQFEAMMFRWAGVDGTTAG